ncbi:MAG: hypothetical protein RR313_01045 [Anaerovoracaceae bacterium]
MNTLTNTQKVMLKKALDHYYSLRIAAYLPKEKQVDIYKKLVMIYCQDHGVNVDEHNVVCYIYDRLKDFVYGYEDNIA